LNKRLRVVVSLPNDNAYQHEQALVAKSAGAKLGIDLSLLHANDDSITQSQQLLEIIQSRTDAPPSAFLVEPVTATGLRRVAEAAVAKNIAWVISNSDVDYIQQLRKNPRIPVFIVTQGQFEIGRLQGKQLAALLPQGGSVLYIAGPSMSSVAAQRFEGMESARPRNVQLTTPSKASAHGYAWPRRAPKNITWSPVKPTNSPLALERRSKASAIWTSKNAGSICPSLASASPAR
jgi:ABC-type sugar transport system substrate-binding protein